MVIIRLKGGLGNQMFQISLGKALEKKGKDVYFDKIDLKEYLELHDWDEADSIFNIGLKYASQHNISRLSLKKDTIIKRVLSRFIVKKSHYYEQEGGLFDSDIFNMDDVYLDGYWQTEKYFNNISDYINKMFKFKKIEDLNNVKLIDSINEANNSVSIHIRLGDYTNNNNSAIFGGICTKDYYDRAIESFKNKYNNIQFYIFSNDKNYLKKYYNRKDFIIVNCNDERNAWKDMYLMSLCKHNIIANSSFSWWGAYLNNNENKIVVAPKKWLNTCEMKDICPESWTRI